MRSLGLLALAPVLLAQDPASDPPVVFRSDVALARVDAQVVDRSNRTVVTLDAEDFVVRDGGKEREVRKFSREDMPMDLLMLIDVSRSMRPHVERLARAAGNALQAMGPNDRVGFMVFDRQPRIRSDFRPASQLEREFQYLLDQEDFNGGTDITKGLIHAANYMGSHARPGARRAIVILTDDQTEKERDVERVETALIRNDTVLSALLSPNAMIFSGGGGGGGWPNDPGGILFPRRRGPWGNGGPVIVGGGGAGTRSAKTAEIAEASGGDSMRVDDATAFEQTVARLRQRYALFYYIDPAERGDVDVALTPEAKKRIAGAKVRFRRIEQGASADMEAVSVSRTGTPSPDAESPRPTIRRRPGVSPNPDAGARPNLGADPRSTASAGSAVTPAAQPAPAPKRGGWRRVTDPEPESAPDAAMDAPTGPAAGSEPADPGSAGSGKWRREKP